MKTFDIVMIPLFLVVAALDLAVGIARLFQGNTEAGILYLTFVFLFVNWAVQAFARVVGDEYP